MPFTLCCEKAFKILSSIFAFEYVYFFSFISHPTFCLTCSLVSLHIPLNPENTYRVSSFIFRAKHQCIFPPQTFSPSLISFHCHCTASLACVMIETDCVFCTPVRETLQNPLIDFRRQTAEFCSLPFPLKFHHFNCRLAPFPTP